MNPAFGAIVLGVGLCALMIGLGWAWGFSVGVFASVRKAYGGGVKIDGEPHVLVPAHAQAVLEADAESWRKHRGW